MRLIPVLFLSLLVLAPLAAQARPTAPVGFCDVYPDAAGCQGAVVECTTCHTAPPARNPYGQQVAAALAPDEPRPLADERFLLALPEALRAVELEDADGDGAPNLEEVMAGSRVWDPRSLPVYDDCDGPTAKRAAQADNGWNTCDYDAVHAFRRVHIDVCGQSPTLEEIEEFAGSVKDGGEDWQGLLADSLDRCLATAHWVGFDGVLHNLANRKITPAAAIKAGEGQGDIPLGDYDDDYNLFVYTQSGDRDAREVLTAQYFVRREGEGGLQFAEFSNLPILDAQTRGFFVAQLVPEERRAGLLTTRWNLVMNTMFTSIPRTTAAQAYRAYLGYDISRMEGLQSVPGEPVDYDNKGVQAPTCAACHATLDPLTYPFSRYDGLGGGDGALIGDPVPENDEEIDVGSFINPDGTSSVPLANYVPDRLERFPVVDGPLVDKAPEAGVLLGKPVADLIEWAEVAAESEAFARATVLDYWRLLVGEDPRPSDNAAFTQLWKAFMTTHEYRVERMLHDLIRTEAYGAP